jgi:hypothetical protein
VGAHVAGSRVGTGTGVAAPAPPGALGAAVGVATGARPDGAAGAGTRERPEGVAVG